MNGSRPKLRGSLLSYRAQRRGAAAEGKRVRPWRTPQGAGKAAMSIDVRADNRGKGLDLAQMDKLELRRRRSLGLESARYQKRVIKATRREWAENRRSM